MNLKRKHTFTLPIVMFVISLCVVLCIFSYQQLYREKIHANVFSMQNKMEMALKMGEKTLVNTIKIQGYEAAKDSIVASPVVFLKSESTGDYNIVLTYSWITRKLAGEVYYVSAFLLKPEYIGDTTVPVVRVPIYLNAYRRCNVIPNKYVQSAHMTIEYIISYEPESLGEIFHTELKRINYVE